MTENSQADAAVVREKSGWTVVGITCVLMVVLYIGGYFAVVDHQAFIWVGGQRVPFWWTDKEGSQKIPTAYDFPNYGGLPDWFFAPIHEVDRRWLRPDRWSMKTFWDTPKFRHPPNPIGSVRFWEDEFPEEKEKAKVKSSPR